MWTFKNYHLNVLEDDLVETRKDLKAVYLQLNQVLSKVFDIKKQARSQKLSRKLDLTVKRFASPGVDEKKEAFTKIFP